MLLYIVFVSRLITFFIDDLGWHFGHPVPLILALFKILADHEYEHLLQIHQTSLPLPLVTSDGKNLFFS